MYPTLLREYTMLSRITIYVSILTHIVLYTYNFSIGVTESTWEQMLQSSYLKKLLILTLSYQITRAYIALFVTFIY